MIENLMLLARGPSEAHLDSDYDLPSAPAFGGAPGPKFWGARSGTRSVSWGASARGKELVREVRAHRALRSVSFQIDHYCGVPEDSWASLADRFVDGHYGSYGVASVLT